MARWLKEDTIDFSAYLRDTEAAVKVRRASVFTDELKAQFAVRDPKQRLATMGSTKLRDVIEFRPGEVTCWAGYNGHRKSMFTGQVAIDLCMANQRVLVKSFELQPARSLARMARQASGVLRPSHGWLEQFSRWSDNRLWMFDHMGRLSPQTCLAVCRYFADELKGQHVFIDSMMMVCASEESLDEQKQFATDLVRLAIETSLHVHLIAHCRKPNGIDDKPPTRYELRGSAAISDQAHNVITIWENKAKRRRIEADPNDISALDEPDAVVLIDKQREGEFEGKTKLWFHTPSLRFCDDRISPVEPYLLA